MKQIPDDQWRAGFHILIVLCFKGTGPFLGSTNLTRTSDTYTPEIASGEDKWVADIIKFGLDKFRHAS